MRFTLQKPEKKFRFDFSATGLPLKPKKSSIFKSVPLLLSFYELVSAQSQVLHESEVSKIATSDPFWTLTEPLGLS